MIQSKTHTLLVRGVSKSTKNVLKRAAKEKKHSVNGLILEAIDLYIATKQLK